VSELFGVPTSRASIAKVGYFDKMNSYTIGIGLCEDLIDYVDGDASRLARGVSI
jgi:hypothetical protein